MNKTLFRQTIKSNAPLFLVILIVNAGMLLMNTAIGQTISTVATIHYQMLAGLLIGVFVIVTANKLIAAQVDKGTLAHILSTPVTRWKVVGTQAFYLISSLLLICVAGVAAHSIAAYLFLDSFVIEDLVMIIELNIGLFALAAAFSGICFLASCTFNLSKNAIAIGGGIVAVFILLSMVSSFSPDLAWLKNLTISSLYDISSIVEGTTDFIWKAAVLGGIGVVTYGAGMTIFAKKDLPL